MSPRDSDPDSRGSGRPADPAFPDDQGLELEPDCTRCPALVDARERISWGNGPEDASIVVVGEAPGYGNPDADRWKGGNWTGKAYTSRHSGRRIRRLLERVGFGDDAYYTNAVKCFPSEPRSVPKSASGETASHDPDDPTTNREPTPEERANCRPHLLRELEILDPATVLATGKHATKTVLAAERAAGEDGEDGPQLEGFVDSVLEPIRCDALGVHLVPVLHPSYQDVWIGRLGYEPAEYRAAIRDALEETTERAEESS